MLNVGKALILTRTRDALCASVTVLVVQPKISATVATKDTI